MDGRLYLVPTGVATALLGCALAVLDCIFIVSIIFFVTHGYIVLAIPTGSLVIAINWRFLRLVRILLKKAKDK